MHLQPGMFAGFESCISISLLPAIIVNFVNIDHEILFMILYPLLFALTPLTIYLVCKKYLDPVYAFLASSFFMLQFFFLQLVMNARTSVAIFFIALTFYVLCLDNLEDYYKKLLVIVFLFSCIISHYTSAYILCGILFCAILVQIIIKKILNIDYKNYLLSPLLVLLVGVFTFLWHIEVNKSTFGTGVSFINNMFDNFFVYGQDMKSMPVQNIMASGVKYTTGEIIKYGITWVTFVLIGIGVCFLSLKYIIMLNKSGFFNNLILFINDVDIIYIILSIVSCFLLVITILLPLLSVGYGIERLYQLVLIFLSLAFIIGGMVVSKILNINSIFLLTFVIVIYGCSVTGVTDQVLGNHDNVVLNSIGPSYNLFYVNDHDSFAGKWLRNNYDAQIPVTALDGMGQLILVSQGGFNRYEIYTNTLETIQYINSYIYLRSYNVNTQSVAIGGLSVLKMPNYYEIVSKENIVYSSKESMILLSY
jgi:uncharacterized membrane protein